MKPCRHPKDNAIDHKLEFRNGCKWGLDFYKYHCPKAGKRQSTYGSKGGHRVIPLLYEKLDMRGILDVLHIGFVDFGLHFWMVIFQITLGLNSDADRIRGRYVE